MPKRVAYISTYIPKKCGLATYTHNLRKSIGQSQNNPSNDVVISIVDSVEEIIQPGNNLLYIKRNSLSDYHKTARYINGSNISIVFLQHEFGIFGGRYGSYIFEFIKQLRKPLATTFHTVGPDLTPDALLLQQKIGLLSRIIFVMNNKASDFLHHQLSIPKEKIVCIPHGSPVPPKFDRDQLRKRLNWDGKKVMMSFGLLSKNKGFEFILNILPQLKETVPDFLYVIIGETHPLVKRNEGEAYRSKLCNTIIKRGLENHVVMLDQYFTEEELIKYLMLADLFIVPYPGVNQSSSGVLSYAVGLGKPLLATPFTHAQELLKDYDELLISFGDKQAWGRKIIKLLSDPVSLQGWEEKIGLIGKSIHWPVIGKLHADILDQINN